MILKIFFLGRDLNVSIVRSGKVIGGGDRAEKRLLNDFNLFNNESKNNAY